MTVSVASSGTLTPTVATLATLATITTAGTYVLKVDTFNMALGDQLTLSIGLAVVSGGTSRTLYQATYRHQQAISVKVSPPVTSPLTSPGVVFTLTQDTGTARAFPWAIELL